MLVVDFDSSERCHNPGCRAPLEAPGEEYRYCTQCGSPQVFECEACPTRPGAVLRVAHDSQCPACGALYALCGDCHFPLLVLPREPMACPNGCGAGMVTARTGTHEPLAEPRRTGAVTCRFGKSSTGPLRRFSLGEPSGPPAARYGRVYFVSSRGTFVAVDEDSGKALAAWEQPLLSRPDPATLGAAVPQVSERYVYLHDGHAVHACSAVSGDHCFSVPFAASLAHCVIRDDRLLVQGIADPGALSVRLYDTLALCAGEPGLLHSERLPARSAQRPQPPGPAAVAGHGFIFRDLDGNLRALPAGGEEESRVLWANAQFGYVSAPTVTGEHVYALLHGAQRGTAVLQAPLTHGAAETWRLASITPFYGTGLRVAGSRLYLYDGQSSYYELDLAAPSVPPQQLFLGERLAGDMAMAWLVALLDPGRDGCWLLSLAGRPEALKARLLHTQTREFLQLDVPQVTELAAGASDRHIFITDTRAGETLVYDIPTPSRTP